MTADPPYLFADLYEGDNARPAWTALSTCPPWVGAIIKCTEGLHYAPEWFVDQWPRIKNAAPERYGFTFYRGCYHFLRMADDGRAQADAYLAHVERAGGWGSGDILPIVDVERAGNAAASAQQVIDVTSAWTERVRDVLGRRIMLYGRGLLRDLGIKDRMGCDVAWCPSYTAELVTHGLEAFGLERIPLWQYAGDGVGDASRHHLPLRSPIGGDVSVFIDGPNKPTLERLRAGMI